MFWLGGKGMTITIIFSSDTTACTTSASEIYNMFKGKLIAITHHSFNREAETHIGTITEVKCHRFTLILDMSYTPEYNKYGRKNDDYVSIAACHVKSIEIIEDCSVKVSANEFYSSLFNKEE
jgi:hypothetical protein